MLKLSNIHFSYGETKVLKGIDLDVKKGEIVSIVGSSGAGKTTLLHILGTLEKAETGNYSINDKSIVDLSTNELSKFRNLEVGFIFQFHNLLPEFSAFENIVELNISVNMVIINNLFILILARPRGFEPLTHSLEGCCSIQLSYGRLLKVICVRFIYNFPF